MCSLQVLTGPGLDPLFLMFNFVRIVTIANIPRERLRHLAQLDHPHSLR